MLQGKIYIANFTLLYDICSWVSPNPKCYDTEVSSKKLFVNHKKDICHPAPIESLRRPSQRFKKSVRRCTENLADPPLPPRLIRRTRAPTAARPWRVNGAGDNAPRNSGSFPDRLSIDSVPASCREEAQQIATPAHEITSSGSSNSPENNALYGAIRARGPVHFASLLVE